MITFAKFIVLTIVILFCVVFLAATAMFWAPLIAWDFARGGPWAVGVD